MNERALTNISRANVRRFNQRSQVNLAALERLCMNWNGTYPIGTEVEYHSVIGAPKHVVTRTRSGAYVLSGHTAVVFVEGVSGCVALEAVQPVTK